MRCTADVSTLENCHILRQLAVMAQVREIRRSILGTVFAVAKPVKWSQTKLSLNLDALFCVSSGSPHKWAGFLPGLNRGSNYFGVHVWESLCCEAVECGGQVLSILARVESMQDGDGSFRQVPCPKLA